MCQSSQGCCSVRHYTVQPVSGTPQAPSNAILPYSSLQCHTVLLYSCQQCHTAVPYSHTAIHQSAMPYKLARPRLRIHRTLGVCAHTFSVFASIVATWSLCSHTLYNKKIYTFTDFHWIGPLHLADLVSNSQCLSVVCVFVCAIVEITLPVGLEASGF